MKYLFGTFVLTLVALSFAGPKCDHVFTEVEQAEIKIEQPAWNRGIIYPEGEVYQLKSGKVEGADLICVKCFHKQKQILDYGQPQKQNEFGFTPIGIGDNPCDTLHVFGRIYFKLDTLVYQW